MTKEETIQKITTLLKQVKISQKEKDSLLSKLPASTDEQLERLHDNLLMQITTDIYFDYLEELEKDDRLLGEDDYETLMAELARKFETAYNYYLTESEIGKVRQNLSVIKGNANTETAAPATPLQVPQQAPAVPVPPVFQPNTATPPVTPSPPPPNTN